MRERVAEWSAVISALGTLLIGVGLLLSHLQLKELRLANTRAFTFDLLGDMSENEDLAEANFQMVALINIDARINESSLYEPFPDRSGKNLEIHVEDEKLVTLLNYYELLATAWSMGSVDEDLLFQVRGGPMKRCFDVAEGYIEDRRRRLKAPRLYRRYEELVKAYKQSRWASS